MRRFLLASVSGRCMELRCTGLRRVRMDTTGTIRMLVHLMGTTGRRGLAAESLLALVRGSVAATMGAVMVMDIAVFMAMAADMGTGIVAAMDMVAVWSAVAGIAVATVEVAVSVADGGNC